MKKLVHQQGDVLLFAVESIPERASRVVRNGVVAQGEVTGHAHRFVDDKAVQLYSLDEILYALVAEPVELVHEEHGSQLVHPGIYEVGIVQEYDYATEEARHVQD